MNLTIDHKSPVALHRQVEDLLRQLIDLPEYKNGELLPKEVDLAKQLGISRNTVRQATNKLELEGLIFRKKGYGTKVSPKMVHTKLDHWHSFTQEMNESGVNFTNYEITADSIKCNDFLAAFFEIPKKTNIIHLQRLRGDDDGPFVYFESYFHPRIGIKEQENFQLPLYEILENKYNIRASISQEHIRAKKANVAIAKKLKIHVGDIVLVRERFVFDPGKRPVEYNIGYYVAEKFMYSIEI